MNKWRYAVALGMIGLTAVCWHMWPEWARVLNVGTIALWLVESICQTIKDALTEAQ